MDEAKIKLIVNVIIKYMNAFINTNGGILFIGINGKCKIIGISNITRISIGHYVRLLEHIHQWY